MSFFDSELVRAEMTEISILQEDICKNVFTFASMSIEEKKFHIGLLEKLLNKQRILYTRLSLSDDPDAIQFKEQIRSQALALGLGSTDINSIFNNMEALINSMKDYIEKKRA